MEEKMVVSHLNMQEVFRVVIELCKEYGISRGKAQDIAVKLKTKIEKSDPDYIKALFESPEHFLNFVGEFIKENLPFSKEEVSRKPKYRIRRLT
jgi:hypothetical protein